MLKDFTDYKVEKQIIAVGDAVKKDFQFYKKYEDAKDPYIRKVTKIKKDSLKIYINNNEILEGW